MSIVGIASVATGFMVSEIAKPTLKLFGEWVAEKFDV